MVQEHPGRQPNRLIKEKSPYLLQHAYNPVAWYPWGDEALATAAREDKPILLSIGYSTCYWCHRRSPQLRVRTNPFSCRSATPPATGAM